MRLLPTGQMGGIALTAINAAKGGYPTLAASVREGTFDPIRDYGAIGNGVVDDTVAIQAAINAASLVGGLVYLNGSFKVTSLTMADGASLAGPSRANGQLYGAHLIGTTGQDVLVFPSNYAPITVRNLLINGGRRAVAALDSAVGAHTYVTFEDCDFGSNSENVYLEGHCEEWHFVRCQFSGGTYGIRFANVHALSGTSLFDKSYFTDCIWGGQTINNVRLEAQQGSCVTFLNPIFNTAGQHSVWIDGGFSALLFINPNTEGGGQTGKNNRTTLVGAVAPGATSGTLTNATGWTNGDSITIAGADIYGQDLSTVVTSLVGTAVGWTTATTTSVTGPIVTNAVYDDFHFATSIATPTVQFVNGSIGGEGTGGHLRYSINNPGIPISLMSIVAAGAVPLYDAFLSTTLVGSCNVSLRRPNLSAGLFLYSTDASVATDNQQRSAIAVSPAGGEYIIALRDSLDNAGGTYGQFTVRRSDANRTPLLQVNTGYGTYINEQLNATAGIAFWGHAPVTQPAAPVTLADVIAIIRGCGLSA